MLTLTRKVGESIRIGDEIEITVVDIRGDGVRVLRTTFQHHHIPGAQFLDLQGDLADPDSPYHFMLPTADVFEKGLRRFGIRNDSIVVIYSSGNPWWATRIWWMFHHFGLDNAYVLDGGLKYWLQRGLPVDARYKAEQPGTDSDLNAYDAVYYGGDANAGSKSIAINLPNDEEVQLARGTRRLQLKNAMQAKFDEILVPIAELLIAPDQRDNVTFDAFFSNVMFHEVAHGLGIKNTINGSGTVREALKEHASALEEGKADVLGLYMVTSLQEQGELGDAPLEDYYTTFLASIFRSVRFGAASAHGRANMARFNYFAERGAFERDPDTGTYHVNVDQMRQAMNDLSELILTLQGNGDYGGVAAFVDEYGIIGPELQAGLDRVNASGIPVDVVWEQGREVLGLD